jgi:hypothetical protein
VNANAILAEQLQDCLRPIQVRAVVAPGAYDEVRLSGSPEDGRVVSTPYRVFNKS